MTTVFNQTPAQQASAAKGNPAFQSGQPADAGTAQVLANQQAAAKLGVSIPGVGGGSQNQSTTTLSSNKTAEVSNIQNKTNQLSQTGITTDANGVATYANGTVYNPPQQDEQSQDTSSNSQQGGYYGDTYVKPGDPIPTDASGNSVTLTALPPAAQANIDSYQQLMTRSDAMTASLVASVQAQYQQLIQQQTQANAGAGAGQTNMLLHNGGLQHTLSGGNVLQSQVSYGLQQLADLSSKESIAITQAQQAGLNQDFQLQGKINDQVEQIRQEKTAILTKQANDLATQNQKIADEKLQASKDSFVASQLSSGISDPATILANAKASGLTTISADDVSKALTSVTPDAAAVVSMAGKYPDAGITRTDTIGQATAKILKSDSYSKEEQSAALDLAYKQSQIAKNNADIAAANLGSSATVDIPNGTGGTISVPQVLSPYIQTFYDGTNYADLSSLTPTDKAKYAQVAQQAGIKPILDTGTAGKLNAISVSKNNLQSIEDSVSGILNNNQIAAGKGLQNTISSYLGNADIKSFNAWRTAVINNVQALAGGQGSGLRINQAEIDTALKNDLPTITGVHADTLDQAKAKITTLNKQLDTWSKQILGGGNVAKSAGPDLSSYQDGGSGQPSSNGVDLSKFNQ